MTNSRSMASLRTRRSFLGLSVSGAAGLLASGCVAPLVSPQARDADAGAPWRCEHCGHLMRSRDDLSDRRCPRCRRRRLTRITEAEMTAYLRAGE